MPVYHVSSKALKNKVPISIIVTCHNYGKYLRNCLNSIIEQTVNVAEIIIINDSSKDDSQLIIDEYQKKYPYLIRSKYVSYQHIAKSKSEGIKLSNSACDYVLFVDADNFLPPMFVETAIKVILQNTNIGVVYCDLQKFGDENYLHIVPDHLEGKMAVGPYIDSCSVIRREIFDIIPDWTDCLPQPDDYKLFQLIEDLGFDFKKHITPLMYRVHSKQDTQNQPKSTYAERTGFEWRPITLFIPLSGRFNCWKKQSALLEKLNYDKSLIKIVICDTSQNTKFGKVVKNWLANSEYNNFEYFTFTAGIKDLVKQDRDLHEVKTNNIHLACCKIYNEMRKRINTNWTWILEDDVIPDPEVLNNLIKYIEYNVGSVAAPYYSRHKHDKEPLVWVTHGEIPGGGNRAKPAPEISHVAGYGFGCMLIRSKLLKDWVFRLPSNTKYYDPVFFKYLDDKWIRVCDWNNKVDHIDDDEQHTSFRQE